MFNPSSFSPVSFSRISFNGVQAANEGRSGYWRLFFTNLQEEALKTNEATNVDSGKLVASKVAVGKNKKQSKPVVPKKRKGVEAPKPANPAIILPFRKLPTKPEPTVFDLLAKLPPLALEQYIFSLRAGQVIISLDKERKRRRRKKVAAILLMAA